MDGWVEHIFLFSVGVFSGILNVTAGGGSFLTLPVLIFLGLPAAEANGTNRVGIFLQNIGAVWSFHRHGIVEWYWVMWAMGPGLVGCVIGTWLALIVGEETFQKILAVLMFGVIVWTFWDPLGNIAPLKSMNATVRFGVVSVGFLGIGLYAGFLQAGVGFFILGLAVAVGLDFVRGNALKVLSVLIFYCSGIDHLCMVRQDRLASRGNSWCRYDVGRSYWRETDCHKRECLDQTDCDCHDDSMCGKTLDGPVIPND